MNNDTTIGLDLGNKKHKVVGLDGRGQVVLKCELNNDKETLGAFFKEHLRLFVRHLRNFFRVENDIIAYLSRHLHRRRNRRVAWP